jgi:glycosyltransferase involved in cell wall biosynthesis
MPSLPGAAGAPASLHLLVNGLSIGSSGGYAVGRALAIHVAAQRPAWRVTFALTRGSPLHEEILSDDLPPNCAVHWAPPSTLGLLGRLRHERGELRRFIGESSVSVVLQLNGMLLPGCDRPTLCHNQDPMAYRPEAWEGWRDRLRASVRRRAQRKGLRHAAFVGWTSTYLRDLMTNALGVRPHREEVFYNGVPQGWIDRAFAGVAPLAGRAKELLTVSDVTRHKRQSLVIEALPEVIRRTGLHQLRYRVLGRCFPTGYDEELRALASRHGVGANVLIEGRVSAERVQEAYARASAFVLMSVCESFGIPAVEAMTWGTPVIVADCTAMPEVCGDAAELVPIDDAAQLAERLAVVLTDRPRAEALQRRGVERVARFAWPSIAERVALRVEEIAARSQRVD